MPFEYYRSILELLKKWRLSEALLFIWKSINRYAVYFLKQNQELTTITPCHVSHWNYIFERDRWLYCTLLVLSTALMYMFAERIHVDVSGRVCACVFYIAFIHFLFIQNCSFAVSHVKHSLWLLFLYISSHHDAKMTCFSNVLSV